MFLSRFEQLSQLIRNGVYTILSNQKLTEKEALQAFHGLLLQTKKNKGITYVIGNGGSAGIASHFCIDLLNTLNLRAQTLYDPSMMTCIANDYGYEHVFSRPLSTLLSRNDLLICISSSGQSPNILNAAYVVKKQGLPLITLSGFDSDNPLRALGNLNLYLESCDYGLVETGHFFLLHSVIDLWLKSDISQSINHTSLLHAK